MTTIGAFQPAVSGMSSQSHALDVISTNIANVTTTGYKRTDTNFQTVLSGILASSHRLVHALMALEAGLASSPPIAARPEFRVFADDVERTLYYLAAALRGSDLKREALPDLREGHHRLVHAGDPLTERYALVNIETDRITNSLNTLAEEVFR